MTADGNFTFSLQEDLAQAVKASIQDWKLNEKVKRMWKRDASLWTNTDESKWLGWLTITEEQIANLPGLQKIA